MPVWHERKIWAHLCMFYGIMEVALLLKATYFNNN